MNRTKFVNLFPRQFRLISERENREQHQLFVAIENQRNNNSQARYNRVRLRYVLFPRNESPIQGR